MSSSKSTDSTAQALLIEHFGFAPLKLIDEVINAINQITGKGIEALEEYLLNLKSKNKLIDVGGDDKLITDEIFTGSAKLESLLQFKIDIFFDKFELYSLSNIFHIPQDLIDDGLITLKHQPKVVGDERSLRTQKNDYDYQIFKIYELIEKELIKRKLYILQILKCEKILNNLKFMKNQLQQINEIRDNNSDDKNVKNIIRNLKPIDETLEFFYNQLNLIILQIEKLNNKLDKPNSSHSESSRSGNSHSSSGSNGSNDKLIDSRNQFIELRMKKIMNDLKLNIPTPPPSPNKEKLENGKQELKDQKIENNLNNDDENNEIDIEDADIIDDVPDSEVMKQIVAKIDE